MLRQAWSPAPPLRTLCPSTPWPACQAGCRCATQRHIQPAATNVNCAAPSLAARLSPPPLSSPGLPGTRASGCQCRALHRGPAASTCRAHAPVSKKNHRSARNVFIGFLRKFSDPPFCFQTKFRKKSSVCAGNNLDYF
jgi:hypothetical protein